MRRAVLSQPLLAHPAKSGGVPATCHPDPRKDAEGHQQDADAYEEEHMLVAAFSRLAILTGGSVTVCALVHTVFGT